MSEILRTTAVGDVTEELPALNDKFFPVVRRTVVDPSGQTREQLVWDRRGKSFAMALAMTEDGNFVMINEPKYGQEKIMLTIPCGGLKKGETPEQAAARELFEESGYVAEKWIKIRENIVDFPDKTDGGQHTLFLALNARKEGNPENLREVKLFNKGEFERLIDGQIDEMKLEIAMSLVGATLALRYLDKEQLNTP